jgi:hypothetical protein
MAAKTAAASLHVTQIKSSISHIARNRATLKALGLHGIGSRCPPTTRPGAWSARSASS